MALPGLNWTRQDVDVLHGTSISEVDMADAGMTVIRQEGMLPPDAIRWLEGLPKAEKAVQVGLISKELARKGERTISQRVTDGIARRVEAMLDLNGIGTDRLVSVKRDAVFLTGQTPQRLELEDGTRFRVKNTYSAYARLGTVEVYCVPRTRRWDVKGIDDEKKHLHAETAGFLMDTLSVLAAGRPAEAADTLTVFRQDYVARRLPLGFYREFNASSAFCLRVGRSRFLLDSAGGPLRKEDLEITFNLRAVIATLARAIA